MGDQYIHTPTTALLLLDDYHAPNTAVYRLLVLALDKLGTISRGAMFAVSGSTQPCVLMVEH